MKFIKLLDIRNNTCVVNPESINAMHEEDGLTTIFMFGKTMLVLNSIDQILKLIKEIQ